MNYMSGCHVSYVSADWRIDLHDCKTCTTCKTFMILIHNVLGTTFPPSVGYVAYTTYFPLLPASSAIAELSLLPLSRNRRYTLFLPLRGIVAALQAPSSDLQAYSY